MLRSCGLLCQAACTLMTLRPAGIVRMVNWWTWSNCSSCLLGQGLPAGKKPRYIQNGSVIACHFCTVEDHNVSYKELKNLLESEHVQLIDVREKWEIGEHGKIPGSINIPLGEVVEALQMNPEHFKKLYNQDMPSKSDHLVFACMAGVRSKQALAAAKSLGFDRVQHYIGGFKEWAEHESSSRKT
ncbi:thiosulfate sulfurtransferase/rhodanese-like domain-containing protein 3 [Eublepharis macularius]|uniref:Thiosulfate sulfurtransferase/rhodanese-like domain-containing protein 3 n=1 Tax=Eublepharis macularius TaxID=481883 RepID=A0AA97LAV1_EUBMA|nr:thiosulfate sulfurtransferase/rhodanese-like domain-containing protein 3 [Eublepharis macularius]